MENIIATPQTIRRCEICLMSIFDDLEHTCFAPNQRVSWLRTGVYVTAPLPLFEMEFNGDIYHLNAFTEKFEKIFDGKVLLSPSTDGLIKFQRDGNRSVASYASGSFKRFRIVVAMYSENSCRLLFHVETSANHGLLFHKLDLELRVTNGHIVTPTEYNLNTVLILGIETLWMDCRIYANDGSTIDHENFNGISISGFVGSESERSEFVVN